MSPDDNVGKFGKLSKEVVLEEASRWANRFATK